LKPALARLVHRARQRGVTRGRRLVEDYQAFITSFLTIADPRSRAHVDEALGAGLLWPDPLFQPNPAFEPDNFVAPSKLFRNRGSGSTSPLFG
jgi:hypothetical protein